MFKGSFTALITPFKNGGIDEKSLRGLIEFQIEGGTAGLVPCGTTGESATLTHEEHKKVMEIVVDAAKKRVPVIAGTGSNSTAEAIALTKSAKEMGADAALLISPYYNKPTQEGLYRHYKAVAEAVDIPMILYNVPGRTQVNILPETVARLSRIKNIVALKDATGSLQQASDTISRCGGDFNLLSGDDANTLPILSVGGTGVISVTANIAPREVAGLCGAFFRGDLSEARKIHYRLLSLHNAMFIETNPIPVKTALALMGKCEESFRLPLCGISERNRESLKSTLKDFGLI
ncbi:MAG: 4-hydroxy-tetrahydrodipicolinate synthase [Nitrospinae bacterium]|nr:4-hydroxy-tetrahydrodipicolinate synthase [Nitrospinota bacterium]